MYASRALIILTIVTVLCACVPMREIRTEIPEQAATAGILQEPTALSAACNVGSGADHENRRMIENYGSSVLAFAEFDDQGWSYDGDRQLAAIRARLQAELKDPPYAEWDFVVVLFVHGWHHNAHDNDCNVQEACQMVSIASQQFDAAVKAHKVVRKRRVFGIYVGWRGESVNAAGLRCTTIIDRRDTAEKVAKGSVRQLLADLGEQQLIAQAAASDWKAEADQAAGMYTTVVGHSFGGLIVFNALSRRLISDLTAKADAACTPGGAPGGTRPWPDSVLLINPAFEATRFEPLNRLADRAAGCSYVAPHPLLTVITADNDRWTGGVVIAGRRALTLFEGYDDSTPQSRDMERNANLCAIGFVDRYRTHRLCLRSDDASSYATISATLTPVSTADPRTVWSRAVWVVGAAPPDIVDGHDGFLYARERQTVPRRTCCTGWLRRTSIPRVPSRRRIPAAGGSDAQLNPSAEHDHANRYSTVVSRLHRIHGLSDHGLRTVNYSQRHDRRCRRQA
jgi:pimeloyl-ACP methyl ester carboxylesterase